jgi:hypothetical protein
MSFFLEISKKDTPLRQPLTGSDKGYPEGVPSEPISGEEGMPEG